MLMSDVLMWVAIATGFVVAIPALWMLSRGLWPEGFERRSQIARGGIWKSFLIGVVPTVVIGFIIAALGKRLGPVPGLLVSGSIITWGLLGMVGYASLIGERLWSNAEIWKQTRNGGLVLICSALFPLVGWFFLLPLFVVVGLGVNVRTLLGGGRSVAVAPPAIPTA